MNGTSDGYSFTSANYQAGVCGSGHSLNGNIPQGDVNYDAATANMGYPWRMPTKAQCVELKDNTTSEWTTINGVNGRKFINKSYSTKYIFLPAGGDWYDTSNDYIGSYGYFWSATWNLSSSAWFMYFNSCGIGCSTSNPRAGFSIVGVRSSAIR